MISLIVLIYILFSLCWYFSFGNRITTYFIWSGLFSLSVLVINKYIGKNDIVFTLSLLGALISGILIVSSWVKEDRYDLDYCVYEVNGVSQISKEPYVRFWLPITHRDSYKKTLQYNVLDTIKRFEYGVIDTAYYVRTRYRIYTKMLASKENAIFLLEDSNWEATIDSSTIIQKISYNVTFGQPLYEGIEELLPVGVELYNGASVWSAPLKM